MPLLTLTGPAGVGNTRLAMAAATQAAAHFPDGVYFAPLAGVGDPRHLYAAIEDSLGISTTLPGSAKTRLDTFLGQRRASCCSTISSNSPRAPRTLPRSWSAIGSWSSS